MKRTSWLSRVNLRSWVSSAFAILIFAGPSLGCTFSVSLGDGTLSFDLRGVSGTALHEGFRYAAAACAPAPAGGACAGSSLAHQVDSLGNCYRLSDDGAQHTVTALSGARVGVEVALRGGDSCGGGLARAIKLVVVCGEPRPAEVRVAGPCAYVMLIRGPAGCPVECARDAAGAVCGGGARGACMKREAEGRVRCECAEGFGGPACEEEQAAGTAAAAAVGVPAAWWSAPALGFFAGAAVVLYLAYKGCDGAAGGRGCALLTALLALLAAAAAWGGAPTDAPSLFLAPPHAGALPSDEAAAPRCSKTGSRVVATYVPSAFETEWSAGIHAWNQDTCARMIAPGAFEQFQALINVLEAQNNARMSFPGGEAEALWRAALAAAAPLLSRLEHRDAATGALVSSTLLEPLAGMLRDPRKVCYDFLGAAYAAHPFEPPRYAQWDILRPFFFLDPDVKAAVAALAPCPTQVALFSDDAPRALLFDVGASTWNDATGFGIKWLFELNQVVGVTFAHIYAWEAVPKVDFWDGVPLDARSRIHFYNLPASTDRAAESSPVALLQKLARPQDYVVFKLDIDMEPVELLILNDLMSPEIAALVDDVYVSNTLPNSSPPPSLNKSQPPATHPRACSLSTT